VRYIALILACLLMAPAALAGSITFTDAMGVEVTLEKTPERVAALLGSYGDIWLQAGGTLAGATEDIITGFGRQQSMLVIFTMRPKQISLESWLDGYRPVVNRMTGLTEKILSERTGAS